MTGLLAPSLLHMAHEQPLAGWGGPGLLASVNDTLLKRGVEFRSGTRTTISATPAC